MIALSWRDLLACFLLVTTYHLLDRVLYGLEVNRALSGTTIGNLP